jgi:hypothetical protein
MPNVETIIRSVCADAEGRDFLQAAFDEMWEECSGRYVGLGSLERDRVRERLACCLALISTGLIARTSEQASAIANRLHEAVCDTDFLIGDSRTLDLSDLE